MLKNKSLLFHYAWRHSFKSILLSDGHNVNCAELLILIKLLNNMLYNFSSRQFPFTGKTDLAQLIQPKLQFCLNLILAKEPRPVQIIRN